MDVGDWLRSLDLGQYEAVFRASEIDVEVLRELTDADLSGNDRLAHSDCSGSAVKGCSDPAVG
jgi:SAM domain (Sterile alpha motif)